MIHGAIVSAILIIGFAFIVLVFANKESGNMKLTGQIIAVLIVLAAVAVLIHGFTGRDHYGMMRGDMKSIMMEKMEHNMPATMEATKGTKVRGMRHKGLKSYGK